MYGWGARWLAQPNLLISALFNCGSWLSNLLCFSGKSSIIFDSMAGHSSSLKSVIRKVQVNFAE